MIRHKQSRMAADGRPHFSTGLWRTDGLLMTLAGCVLIWLVLTKSLPFALGESNPELALRLDAGNPLALMTLAERARAELLKTDNQDEQKNLRLLDENAVTTDNGATHAGPPLIGSPDFGTPRQAERRRTIIDLAKRLIANDPLNARGFRLLAEMSDLPEEKRQLMQEAVKRSRRESVAVFWLMADSFERGDLADVVAKANVLFKTRASLAPEVMVYLAAVAGDPEGRSLLARLLAQEPDWRGQFFSTLPKFVRHAGDPYELMAAMTDLGSAIAPAELVQYLRVLIEAGLVTYAKEISDALLPAPDQSPPALLINGSFADEPSGLPFDWSLRPGRNVSAEFAPLPDLGNARSLRFSFGAGRVQFPELTQILVLPPGRYRLEGEYFGLIYAPKGVRWEIGCWRGGQLARTEIIRGDSHPSWRPFGLDIEVPDRDDCKAQQLRLFLDARLAAEQIVSGQIAFRQLSLRRNHS
jgi:hypothetical protein